MMFSILTICSLLCISMALPQDYPGADEFQVRKYAEKPNNIKKVSLDDIDQSVQTNQISDSPFSWTNVLGKL